jgi:hypothetical protein
LGIQLSCGDAGLLDRLQTQAQSTPSCIETMET